MADYDYTDPDVSSPDPGPGGGSGAISLYEAVAQIYRTALGREGSAADIQSWINGTGGNLAAIQQGIYASPEAQAYSTQQQTAGATTTSPGSTAYTGGALSDADFQAWFQGATNGQPPTPAQLQSMRAEIEARGWKISTNAAGVAGKVQSPNGRYYDVIQGADSGGKAWQWITPEDAAANNAATGANRYGAMSGLDAASFGSTPAPYQSDPNAPVYEPLAPYERPKWTGGDYVAPTEAELLASPGYASRLNRTMKVAGRQYAAQGTILNGGTLEALDRRAQDYASNEYQNLRANTFDAYKQRYSQFSDDAGRDLASRSLAVNENQNTFQNRTNTYLSNNSRTLSDYLTNLTAKRNSELDYWNRLNDLNGTGASLAGGSR
jgi:hypothetical protein